MKPPDRSIEGNLIVPTEAHFAIVASRFNHLIVDRLIEGALDAFTRHGAHPNQLTLVRVPGAWEIPTAVGRLIRSNKIEAVLALGALIRGDTPHFDHIAQATVKLSDLSAASGIPVAFGILTTDTLEQAFERAGTKSGNKGWEAALTAIEMANLHRALTDTGL